MTPFRYVPGRIFARRMIRPAIFVFFAGFLLMGALSKTDRVSLPPLQMAQYQFSRIFRLAEHSPPGCAEGHYRSDFQKNRCDEYFGNSLATVFWVLFPFLWVGVFYVAGRWKLGAIYRQAEESIQSSPKLLTGVVTDPPGAPGDWFAWFFCLKIITVEVKKGKQLKVYVPEDAPLPKPGAPMTVGDIGKIQKKTRYFAAPYAPHVVVMKG